MENLDYKKKNIKRIYLKKFLQKKPIFNSKKYSFRIRKKLIELKDRELKDREVKIKREIEELFFKPIIVSTDKMDMFEQKEMKKVKPTKNIW